MLLFSFYCSKEGAQYPMFKSSISKTYHNVTFTVVCMDKTQETYKQSVVDSQNEYLIVTYFFNIQ